MQGMRVPGTVTSLVKVTIGVSTARCLNPWRVPRSKMKWHRARNLVSSWALPLPVTKSDTTMMSSGRLL